MDFSNLKAVSKANTKEGKGQSFKFKVHKREESQFKISNKLYAELGLGEGKGLKQFNAQDAVYVAVMPSEQAVFYKDQKGKIFKNEMLLAALQERGINEDKLDLEHAGEQEGINYYKIVVDTENDQNDNSDDEEEEVAEPEQQTEPQAETVAQESDEF